MPIVTVQCVSSSTERYGADKVQELSDALGEIFHSGPGATWVKFEYLDQADYAENSSPDLAARPTFVEILKRSLDDESLAEEASRIATVTGQILARPAENVHVIYLPEGSGRVAFGGKLVPK